MKISIAMATYNGEQYLQEQLQSFVDQTLQPDELVITDDCSSDQTEAIVREFAKSAPFSVVFRRNEKNLGYCGNFNAALMNTTGDLVFLSDQDDIWFPEKIEHMTNVAKRNPKALVVMNDAALTDGELNDVGLTKIGQIRSAGLLMSSFVMGCCCAVRRELLDICLPIPVGYRAHDNWIVAFADGFNAKVIDERVLQYYRRHDSNESQFLANRLTKVTRAKAWIAAVRKRFDGSQLQRARKQAEQLEILIAGVKRATDGVHQRSEVQLSDMLKSCNVELTSIESKINVREKPFLLRFCLVIKLAVQGRYRHANGMRALVGDLLG